MRTMLKCRIPVEAGNKAIKDGSMGRIIETLMGDLKPESAYFFPDQGQRSCVFVFDLKDPSEMPRLAERLFSELDAEIELTPVMNVQELKTGLQKLK